jgi:hypothetical protein
VCKKVAGQVKDVAGSTLPLVPYDMLDTVRSTEVLPTNLQGDLAVLDIFFQLQCSSSLWVPRAPGVPQELLGVSQ